MTRTDTLWLAGLALLLVLVICAAEISARAIEDHSNAVVEKM